MHNNIVITQLLADDFEYWLKLWKGYQIFYQAKIKDEVTQRTWTKLIDPNVQHMYGFVAKVNGQVAGIVHVIEHHSCWTTQPYAYLQDLYTDEAHRGKGVASALIDHVKNVSKIRQCDRVYWLTHESNRNAQLLYDKVAKKTGFIQYRMP